MTRHQYEEEEPEIIYIPSEDGDEEEFEVIMKFELDDTNSKYMLVIPATSDDETDEVYAFRYEEEDDDFKLYMITDEQEWDMVEETFNTLCAAEEEHQSDQQT